MQERIDINKMKMTALVSCLCVILCNLPNNNPPHNENWTNYFSKEDPKKESRLHFLFLKPKRICKRKNRRGGNKKGEPVRKKNWKVLEKDKKT